MKYCIIILVVWHTVVFQAEATGVNIDSLKLCYTQRIGDDNKADVALQLAKAANISFKDALAWNKKAIEHAQKNKGNQLANSYSALSDLYLSITDRDSAALYLEKALNVNLNNKQLHKAIDNYSHLASINLDLGEYIKVDNYYKEKLKLAIDINDSLQIGLANRDIGFLYYFMGEYALSIEYYLKAQDVFDALNNKQQYYITRYYSALMYYEIGDYLNSEKLLDEALVFFKAWEPDNRTENQPSYTATIYKRLALLDIKTENYNRGLQYCDSAFTLLNNTASIAWVYAHRGEIFTKLNNFEKATENFDAARQFIPECNHCYWPIYTNISEYYLHFNMLDSALHYCNKTLERSVTYRYDIRILRTYNVLAQVYKAKGNNEKAFAYSQKYIEWYKSALDKRKLSMLKNAENGYYATKSEKEIGMLNAANVKYKYQSTKQKIIIAFVILLIVVLTVLFFIAMKNQKQKQRILEREREMDVIKSKIVGQEAERSRISRELHDGIASDLSGIHINLQNMPIYKDQPVIMDEILNQISNIGNEVRSISHNLASPVFNNTTLEEIIQAYITQFKGKIKFDIELSIFPTINWNQVKVSIQKELYRIFQEVVNNTTKHTKATVLSVQIVKHNTFLSVIFEDNGKGFEDTKNEGIGLKNMKERVELLNGDIDILSVPNRGASISIEIPLSGVKQKISLS